MRTLGERLYEKLLFAYPADFRREYGTEMYRAFSAQYRRARGLRRGRVWMETVTDLVRTATQEHADMTLSDLRFAIRRLHAYPAAAALAMLSLALGIGAVTTIFSIIYATLLREAPYRDPSRLVMLFMDRPGEPGRVQPFNTADFIDVREQSTSFTHLSLSGGHSSVTLIGSGFAERIRAEFATPETFQMLGVQPAAGRFFTGDDVLQGDKPMVLSYEFWERKFGKDPAVIGQTLNVDGDIRPVMGVAPPGFRLHGNPGQVDVFTAISLHMPEWIQRQVRWLIASGRLKEGVSIDQAREEVRAIAARLAVAYPATNKGWSVTVDPWDAVFRRGLGNTLYPLFGAVSFVLLIACTNVSNLLLARASNRRKEISLRAALGAGRRRLLRELLSDGVVLAMPAALLGVALAVVGIRLTLSLVPGFFPESEIGINGPVLLFTLAVAFLTALAAGAMPAWLASRVSLSEALKEGGRNQAGGGRSWLRDGTVVLQVGLAMTLLVGAGLMIVSLKRARGIDLGFEPRHVVTLDLALSGPRYMNMAPKREMDMRFVEPPVAAYYQRALELASAAPGVESASISAAAPMVRSVVQRQFSISGRPSVAPGERPVAVANMVMGDALSTFGIRLRAGRFLDDSDREGAAWTCVINEAFARQHFPDGQNPLGQFVTVHAVDEEQPRQIVGVVANTRQNPFDDRIQPEIYTSYWQQPRIYPGNGQATRFRPMLALRTSLSVNALTELRKQIAAIDSTQPVGPWQTMRQMMDRRTLATQFILTLMSVFAALALLLAAMGIYAVMSHSVAERTHEIGIRMALGATLRDTMRMVFRRGALLCAAGVGLGIVAAVALSGTMRRFVYGVQPTDPGTIAAVALVLGCVAMLACLAPALRATRVDPVVALRQE